MKEILSEHQFYYKTGQLSEKKEYNQNSEKQGEWIGYFENGQIDEKSNYNKGKLEGEYVDYRDKRRKTL